MGENISDYKLMVVKYIFITIITILSFLLGFGFYYFFAQHNTDLNEFGDYFGGVVGTYISLLAAVLVYITFREQVTANKNFSKQINEERFFNLYNLINSYRNQKEIRDTYSEILDVLKIIRDENDFNKNSINTNFEIVYNKIDEERIDIENHIKLINSNVAILTILKTDLKFKNMNDSLFNQNEIDVLGFIQHFYLKRNESQINTQIDYPFRERNSYLLEKLIHIPFHKIEIPKEIEIENYNFKLKALNDNISYSIPRVVLTIKSSIGIDTETIEDIQTISNQISLNELIGSSVEPNDDVELNWTIQVTNMNEKYFYTYINNFKIK